jgi:hypothetical protein
VKRHPTGNSVEKANFFTSSQLIRGSGFKVFWAGDPENGAPEVGRELRDLIQWMRSDRVRSALLAG